MAMFFFWCVGKNGDSILIWWEISWICLFLTSFGKVLRTQSPPQVKRCLEPTGRVSLTEVKATAIFHTIRAYCLSVGHPHVCRSGRDSRPFSWFLDLSFPSHSQSGHGKHWTYAKHHQRHSMSCPTKHESDWDCHMYPYVNDSSTSFFNGRNHHRSHRFPSF